MFWNVRNILLLHVPLSGLYLELFVLVMTEDDFKVAHAAEDLADTRNWIAKWKRNEWKSYMTKSTHFWNVCCALVESSCVTVLADVQVHPSDGDIDVADGLEFFQDPPVKPNDWVLVLTSFLSSHRRYTTQFTRVSFSPAEQNSCSCCACCAVLCLGQLLLQYTSYLIIARGPCSQASPLCSAGEITILRQNPTLSTTAPAKTLWLLLVMAVPTQLACKILF